MRDAKNSPEAVIWQRVTRFSDALTPTAARALLKLQLSGADLARVKELSAKARSGTLDEIEEREAQAFEQLGCLLDILHSQARSALKPRRRAS